MNKIIDFQRENGLVADGVIGKKTLYAIKAKNHIQTDEMLAHFVAQCDHETGGFKVARENLNYSVNRMLEIFKSDFDKDKNRIISPEERRKAESIVGNPEKIANFVYANQNGNGDEASGDGWRFFGRGSLQLTGKANYKAFSTFTGVDFISNPDLVATTYFFESANFFFTKNKLWSLCTKVDEASIKALTKRINGGYNGLADRIAKTKKYYSILKA